MLVQNTFKKLESEEISKHLDVYPTPEILNPFWSLGFISGVVMFFQFLTGILVAMYYVPEISDAYDSVDKLMREGEYSWFIRRAHQSGASLCFIAIYMHMAKNLYFKNFFTPSGAIWWTGCIIFLLLIVVSFLGYVLPFSQIGFWAAVVISNLVSAVDFEDKLLIQWLWRDYAVGGYTLRTFAILHYILPWFIAGFAGMHLSALHRVGSNDSLVHTKNTRRVNLQPYFLKKDIAIFTVFSVFAVFVSIKSPTFFNDVEVYEPADPLKAVYVIPEWYFLPLFGLIKCVRSKVLGISLILSFFLLLFACPIFLNSGVKNYNAKDRVLYIFLFWNIIVSFSALGWVAAQPVTDFIFQLSGVFALWFFFSFVLLLSSEYFKRAE